MQRGMFFFSLYFLGLVVCVVSTQEQNEQLYCGDLLTSSCGICALWKKDNKCDKEYARDYCAETCGHCKQDDKRTVLDVHYRGCYRDGFVNDFETMIPVQPEFLGVQSCTGECHSRGYPFAAIQDAKFCMCSKREYRRYGMASDENDCATQCLAGSEDEKCGGPWKNAVYEIASRELQSAGVRLSDIMEKLVRASDNEQQPEPESRRIIDRLTEQLNRLRRRRSDYTK